MADRRPQPRRAGAGRRPAVTPRAAAGRYEDAAGIRDRLAATRRAVTGTALAPANRTAGKGRRAPVYGRRVLAEALRRNEAARAAAAALPAGAPAPAALPAAAE